MTSRFRSERVISDDAYVRKGFVQAYKEAFGSAPYYEKYTDEEVVREVWAPHLSNGLVMIVTDEESGGRLIGFGCAMPFKHSPDDVKDFLERLHQDGRLPEEFDYANAWYMSELGVLNEYRGLGAAWELVKRRMWHIDFRGGNQFFMRTAAAGSNSKPMYLKMGGRELPDLQDVSSSDQVLENSSRSDQRVYLWGNARAVASNIDEIQAAQGYIPFATDDD